jgi:hypothetical protein
MPRAPPLIRATFPCSRVPVAVIRMMTLPELLCPKLLRVCVDASNLGSGFAREKGCDAIHTNWARIYEAKLHP